MTDRTFRSECPTAELVLGPHLVLLEWADYKMGRAVIASMMLTSEPLRLAVLRTGEDALDQLLALLHW